MSLPPKPNPYHNWVSFSAILGPYLGIIATVALAEHSGHKIFHGLALPVIAAFQNHLQILLHEGAHFKLIQTGSNSSRKEKQDRFWNDFFTDLFCAVPFLGWVRHYRYFHLEHHKYLLNPEKDPEIEFYAEQGYFFKPLKWKNRIKMYFLDFCGYHALQFFYSYNRYLFTETKRGNLPKPSQAELLNLAIFLGAIVGVSILFGSPFYFLFYWVLPQYTFLFFFLKLQGYGEHTARTDRVETCTRNHRLGPLMRFFIYPYRSELHLEHHLYPYIPWYQLSLKMNPCHSYLEAQ